MLLNLLGDTIHLRNDGVHAHTFLDLVQEPATASRPVCMGVNSDALHTGRTVWTFLVDSRADISLVNVLSKLLLRFFSSSLAWPSKG